MLRRNSYHNSYHKSRSFRFFSVIFALLLAAAAVFLPIPGMGLSAWAGEQLGETDFEDGKGLPWHIVESNTGKMEFEISGGKYIVTILDPGGASRGGEDRWDCQFRHRGLKIVAGHQYRVQYEITPSSGGQYYTKIGNLEGNVEIWHNMSNGYDLDATWDPIRINANETKRVDLTFTANQSMEVAEWAFHLGGDGQYTSGGCFPAGTVITFDNLSLYDLSSNENDYVEEEPWQRSGVLTNQVGYFSGAAKKATLLSSDGSGMDFAVLDASGEVAFRGTSLPFGQDPDSGDNVHILDFSELSVPGTYHIEAENGASSREFTVGDSEKYSALLYDSLNYFYQNRSGIAIESGYITSGDVKTLSRTAGHTTDNAAIQQTWGYTASSGTQDVTGGWYDAGDHGKYVVNGGLALWLLQNQYETALYTGMSAAYDDGTMNLPENSNGYPDLLDEARWEMEWMMTMLVRDGDCRDMVYHKAHDEKWTGLGMAPAEDSQNRIIKPPTTAATLNVAACAAQSARLWKGLDDSFASSCLDVAKRTYAAAKAHPAMYAPLDESVGGGAYGDDEVSDEFYWAAAELYITTGEEEYRRDMEGSSWYLSLPTELKGGESVGAVGSFDWGHTAAAGTLSICLNKCLGNAAVTGSEFAEADENVCRAAEFYLNKEEAQGYGQPYGQSGIAYNDPDQGYIWGSNSLVANNAIVLSMAYLLTGDGRYFNGAVSGMDYLLGRNPMDYSYVTGYGSHTALYPHHRFWSWLIDKNYPLAPCGVLVGGPNSGMQDPWVQGSGWKKGQIAPAKCYLDHIEAWSVNECAINWNAALSWLTGFLTGYSDDGIVVGATGNGSGIHLNPESTAKNTASQGEQGKNTPETDPGREQGQKADPQPGKTVDPSSGGNSTGNKANVSGNPVNNSKGNISGNENAGQNTANSAAAETGRDQGSGTNWPLIIGLVLGFLLLLAVSIMFFIYKMTRLKMQGGMTGANNAPGTQQRNPGNDSGNSGFSGQ